MVKDLSMGADGNELIRAATVATPVCPAAAKLLITIIPAFNEQETISETVKALRAIEPRLCEHNILQRIYVIDDGSSDDTRHVAERAGADRVLRHRINLGLGAAVRTGMAAARADEADVLVKIDADLQHDPADILNLIQPIMLDEAEVVYGYRFERIEYQMPLVRRIGNHVFSRLMRFLTGWPIRDSQPGILALSRTYLTLFRLPGNYNYAQQILIDAYAKGMRFAQVSVVFRRRTTGRSFVTLRYPFRVAPQIFWVIVGLRPMKVFVPIGSCFLVLGSIVFLWELVEYFRGLTTRPVEDVNLVLGSALFGLQTIFFGVLAQLVIENRR
jgi:glycosyltransferase involved in cell wall biosynthesis